MCFLKDMVLQKQPHMRLLLQYALFGQLLLIEFLNLGNHVLNFLIDFQSPRPVLVLTKSLAV